MPDFSHQSSSMHKDASCLPWKRNTTNFTIYVSKTYYSANYYAKPKENAPD